MSDPAIDVDTEAQELVLAVMQGRGITAIENLYDRLGGDEAERVVARAGELWKQVKGATA